MKSRIAAYTREMSDFLMESELNETQGLSLGPASRRSQSVPGTATIHYTIPTPEDNDIGGADFA